MLEKLRNFFDRTKESNKKPVTPETTVVQVEEEDVAGDALADFYAQHPVSEDGNVLASRSLVERVMSDAPLDNVEQRAAQATEGIHLHRERIAGAHENYSALLDVLPLHVRKVLPSNLSRAEDKLEQLVNNNAFDEAMRDSGIDVNRFMLHISQLEELVYQMRAANRALASEVKAMKDAAQARKTAEAAASEEGEEAA